MAQTIHVFDKVCDQISHFERNVSPLLVLPEGGTFWLAFC